MKHMNMRPGFKGSSGKLANERRAGFELCNLVARGHES